jgi:Glyoxalase-like domain
MSQPPRTGAVVFARDLARVARFYEVLASMTVAHAAPDHIVLESADFELVLHAIPKRIADTIEIAVPPKRRTETPIKLFFGVASLAETRAAAVALGGALNPEKAEWEARGFRACDGHDPEGNVVQFRQVAG